MQTKLACPKCKGTTFEVYLIEIPSFFQPILTKDTALHFLMEKCLNCGWKTHSTDRHEVRRMLQMMFKRCYVSEEGFIKAE